MKFFNIPKQEKPYVNHCAHPGRGMGDNKTF